MVHEAPPDPPQGPIRDVLADDAAARVDRAVALMNTVVDAYNERVAAVVEARIRGPRARKGTRFWAQQEKSSSPKRSDHGRCQVNGYGPEQPSVYQLEYKSLDASYVVPDKTVNEIADSIRPVGLRIVADAASHVAKSLGRPNTGLAAFDWRQIENAVDSAVEQMLGAAGRQAQEIRRAVLDADSTAENLDDVITRVSEAVRRGGNWLKIYGRTLATALAGDAALGAARALGVTHTQWLSRRDDRVRHTHVIADGQERPVGGKFTVGQFRLRFPADPEVLPAGISEVINCRCGLLFSHPTPEREHAVDLVQHWSPAAARYVLTAQQVAQALGAPELGTMSVPEVITPVDVVGFRVIDGEVEVEPGQRLSWPGVLVLGLGIPATASAGATVLAVAVSAGTAVGMAQGALVLPAGASLAVASVSQGQIIATPVMPATVAA